MNTKVRQISKPVLGQRQKMDDRNSNLFFCLSCPVLALSFALRATTASAQESQNARPRRPNILWLSSEDHGPHMGCYGDKFATTPNVDALAAKGTTYAHAWSNAPVCAPARTTIISGLYPPSTGAEHMRSMLPMPAGKLM